MLICLIAIKYFVQALDALDADQIQRNLSMLMIKHKETQVFSRYFDPFISNAFQIFGP